MGVFDLFVSRENSKWLLYVWDCEKVDFLMCPFLCFMYKCVRLGLMIGVDSYVVMI